VRPVEKVAAGGGVTLNEHERAVLAALERDLTGPALVLSPPDPVQPTTRGRLAAGVAGTVAGLVLLVIAAATALVPLGLLAFVVMLGSALLLVRSARSAAAFAAAELTARWHSGRPPPPYPPRGRWPGR
jgi:hypothetical protein